MKLGVIKGSDFLLLGHILIINSLFKKYFNSLFSFVIVIFVEKASVYESFTQYLAFFNFARHELATEVVLVVDRFQKIFFNKGLK